ncbi:MAG: hypothetical protein VKJ85_00475 [Prochlorothrix sp.]|nr:hypothetical protein [Prochlorothrix sp.]
MANPLHIHSPNHSQPDRHRATADLLHRLLCLPDAYPWEPENPATEDYYTALESELPGNADNWEVDSRANFWSLLDAQWQRCDQDRKDQAVTQPSPTEVLLQRFQSFPRQLLADIAARATQLAQDSMLKSQTANTTLADNLVQCVQQAFPHWSEDDLYVLARPYAYAMRSTSNTPTPEGDWEHLSELEQVRLCLAVAKAALECQHGQG